MFVILSAMRKIVVFNLITLDGHFAALDGDISWHNVDDEFNEYAVEQTKSFGGIIFGNTTYTMFEDFWPKALKDPKTSEEDRQIAQTIDDIWKIVFSKSRKNVTWNNSKLFHNIEPKEVKKWKMYEGPDLVIFGSGTIVQQFTNLGLVDEYRLLVNPIVLGKGKSMFKDMKDQLKLTLINTRTFKNGNVLLTYQPTQ